MFKKNTAVTGFTIGLVSATDGSDITTGTPVGYYTLDGGAQTAIGDVSPVHEGNGQWSFDLLAAEMNGDIVGLVFTHASAITAHFTIKTDTKITSDLQDLTAAQVNAECDTALVDYDAPTNAEMVARTLLAADYFDPAVDAVAVVTSVTNQVTADVTAISGDSVAADNLESQYDGTGLSGDTYPSTQSQLSGLANVGSAIHRPAASYVLTTGTQSANTVGATAALDGVRHAHTDAAGAIDFYYEFNIGSGTASSVQATGYITGSNDDVDVYGYDWVAASWVQIGNIQGSSSTSNQVNAFDMFVDMVGSGADKGKVRVRLYKASGLSTATVAIDQIFVAYNQGADGYDLGMIWYDDAASNTNTVVGVDGTSTNPVSTEAAVNTLIASTGLKRVNIAPNSTFTLEANAESHYMTGKNWTLALAGFSIASSYIENAVVSGIATGATMPFFKECSIGNVTLPPCSMDRCGYTGTVTVGSAGDFFLVDGFSQVAGASSPTWDMAAVGATSVSIRRFGGGHSVTNIGAGDVVSAEATVGGTLTVNGTGGEMHGRGMWKQVTDSSGGSVSISDSSIDLDNINIECDTALTDYDPPTNAEMEARTPSAAQLAYIVSNAATGMPVTFTTAGGSTTAAVINLVDGSAGSGTNDQYNGRLLVFTDGTLKGVVTDITDYVGSTKTATITAIPFAPTSSHSARLI